MAIKQAVVKREEEPVKDWTCKANDCTKVGAIDGICRFHFGSDKDKWPLITSRLRDCGWMFGIMDTVRAKMHEKSHKDMMDIIADALQDHELSPNNGETPGAWLYRAEAWIMRPIHERTR